MFILNLQHSFSAAHNLRNYKGDCANIHGHTYNLKISLETNKLDSMGMVVDFKKLKKILKKEIDSKFDHKYINKQVKYNPTAENMAEDIYFILKRKLKTLKSVELWEGPGSSIVFKE